MESFFKREGERERERERAVCQCCTLCACVCVHEVHGNALNEYINHHGKLQTIRKEDVALIFKM